MTVSASTPLKKSAILLPWLVPSTSRMEESGNMTSVARRLPVRMSSRARMVVSTRTTPAFRSASASHTPLCSSHWRQASVNSSSPWLAASDMGT